MARFKRRLAATEYNMKKLKQGIRDEELSALGVTDSPSEDRLGKDDWTTESTPFLHIIFITVPIL